MAVELFAQLQKADPHRLDNMDTYSNLLYVKVRLRQGDVKTCTSKTPHQRCLVRARQRASAPRPRY